MGTPNTQNAVLSLLRDEFHRERVGNFAGLRRIPSTSVRKFLDYFSSLDELEKHSLAEGLAQCALSFIFPSEAHPCKTGNVAYKQYVDAMPLMWDWKYESVRELRMSLAVAKLEPESAMGRSMTIDIKKWIEAIKPVKSTEIRKVVKLALSQAIRAVKVTHEGQYWEYTGQLNGKAVCITIDFSHRSHQLDYWVRPQNHKQGFLGLNYERLMGLSFASWDLMEQANLDQSIALLKEHIVYCAGILERLASRYDGEAST